MIELTNVREFVFAGNATITLESEKTKNHFTYKIRKSEKDDNLYFVRLLCGSNNEEDYTYLGCYYKDSGYFHLCKKWKGLTQDFWPPSLRAISYFFKHIDNIPPKLHVYHEGRCGRCGRKLTTPESIKRGLGPECVGFVDQFKNFNWQNELANG